MLQLEWEKVAMNFTKEIISASLQVCEDGRDATPVSASFWEKPDCRNACRAGTEQAHAGFQLLRVVWERYSAGQELVVLLTGTTVRNTLFLTPGAGTEHRPTCSSRR